MPRYKLTIEYDGTNFVGWQRQANGLSIQQVVEEAVLGLTGEAAVVHGAGRTDAGVHARGQVAHVDLARAWRSDTVRDALNAHMRPHPVAILAAEPVAADFEARFSARRRHYLYRICNRRAPLALERGRAWHVKRRLDAAAMHAAAQVLVGRHDFSTFRDAECQAIEPRPHPRSAHRRKRRRRHRNPRVGALLPAPAGALDRRLARTCRIRQMERRRSRCGARSLRPQALRHRRAAAGALFDASRLLRDDRENSPAIGKPISPPDLRAPWHAPRHSAG